MVNTLARKFQSLKPSVYSSLAMAFAGMGDTFLYPFLPLYAHKIGIPLAWVGVLLSINRFARIFLNPLITGIFKHFELKQVTIFASLLGVCSTIGYGLAPGLIAWLFLRIIWGLCFSALRISTISYALNHQNKGFALGIAGGIYEIGPLLTLMLGPLMILHFDVKYTFYVLALGSSLALIFAYKIPWGGPTAAKTNTARLVKVSGINLLTFTNSLIGEGFLIVTIGIFIQRHYGISTLEVATLSSGFLIFRRLCTLIASPIGGMLVDWIGFRRMLASCVLFVYLGILLLVFDNLVIALVVIFTFNAITNALLPIAASAGKENQIGIIAQNSIYKDAGAAVGTLLGGVFFESPYLNNILLIGALFPLFFVISFINHTKTL